MSAFTNFLTDTELLLVVSATAYVAGVVTSQRVKDAIKGVPSEARSAISSTESNLLSALKQGQSDLIAKLLPAAVKPTPVAPPAAPPVAPVVPGPAGGPAPEQPAANVEPHP